MTRQLIGRLDALGDAWFEPLRGSRGIDRLFYAASEVGDHGLIWLLLAGLRALSSARGPRVALRSALVLTAESVLVNGVIKLVFRRRRPAFDGERPFRLRQPLTSSFPSGHASAAACSVVLLSEGDPLWPLYLALGAVVAASRVHVRIHHLSDVVAGAGIGAVIGLLGRRLIPLDHPGPLDAPLKLGTVAPPLARPGASAPGRREHGPSADRSGPPESPARKER